MTAKKTKQPTKLIDAYIKKLPDWQQDICWRLRRLIHDADPEIVEEWQWRAPAFSHHGLVCFFWGFKKWVTFTFFQGTLIKDKYKLFNFGRANDHNRSIKLTDIAQIRDEFIIEYVQEAVSNNIKNNYKKPDVKNKQSRS